MEKFSYIDLLDERLLNEELVKEFLLRKSGLDGERKVKKYLAKIPNLIYIHDLELSISNHIQIDFLLVTDTTIYILEIKNYSGDYYMENNQMKNEFGSLFNSPINQIKRCKFELERILAKLGINRKIDYLLIFTNPTFTLHSEITPRDKVLLPTELNKLYKKFETLDIERNTIILEKICSMRNNFSHKYDRLKQVPFHELKPGIRCTKCRKVNTLNIEHRKKFLRCNYCGKLSVRKEIYLYNLYEFYRLKKEPFTLNEVNIWLGGVNKAALRRVCHQHFKFKGKNYKRYYL